MNSIVDPYATKIVYDAPVALHRSVGMDITRQVRLDPRCSGIPTAIRCWNQ